RLDVEAARTGRAGIVAAPQAVESRHAVRAISLFAVLVTARAITLAGHPIPLSAWTPIAYLWQDVCVVLLFSVIDRVAPRGFYALLVAYTAINIPVALVLSTPM